MSFSKGFYKTAVAAKPGSRLRVFRDEENQAIGNVFGGKVIRDSRNRLIYQDDDSRDPHIVSTNNPSIALKGGGGVY